jgi:hypothetical protein
MEKTRPMAGVQYEIFCAQEMIEETQLRRDESPRAKHYATWFVGMQF